MASVAGRPQHAVTRALRSLDSASGPDDVYEQLRRVEAARPDCPRVGRTRRLAQDCVRIGQLVSLAFAASAIAHVEPPLHARAPWRLLVQGPGLLGPNGPLPLHITEYVYQRIQHHADYAFARFLDVFHHRMLSFLYRAWVDANPAVSHDRPEHDRVHDYVRSLVGIVTHARPVDHLANRAAASAQDPQPDPHDGASRCHYAGRFIDPAASPEGLCALILARLGLRAQVQEFVGEWCALPAYAAWQLCPPSKLAWDASASADAGRLGRGTQLGQRVWLWQGKFRLVLGPLTRSQFERVSPRGADLDALVALVTTYVGMDLTWDVQLTLAPQAFPSLQLGASKLRRTSWLWRGSQAQSQGGSHSSRARDDLVFDPQAVVSAAARLTDTGRTPARASPFVM
jgi:type VI secretion system protein ImpH